MTEGLLAGVTTRTDGDPWPAHGLTADTWYQQPTGFFRIATLTATQPGVLFEALIAEPDPVGGDPLPHVVVHGGRTYLEDGHTRVVRALIAGRPMIRARYVEL